MPDELTAEDKRFIKRLRERAESSDVSRRDLLQLGGATGLGALLGAGGLFGMTGGARAGTAQVGTLGEPGSPIDAVAEDLYGPGGQGSGDAVNFEALAISDSLIAQSVAASGSVTLSSGSATVDTGLSATDATFTLALGVDDPNADVDLAGRLFWDDSAGTYKVQIVEATTSVGNPTANYDVVRVR